MSGLAITASMVAYFHIVLLRSDKITFGYLVRIIFGMDFGTEGTVNFVPIPPLKGEMIQNEKECRQKRNTQKKEEKLLK